MNAEIIEALTGHSKALRARENASAGDREGAYFIERAVEHLTGADKKRDAQAKAEAPAQETAQSATINSQPSGS